MKGIRAVANTDNRRKLTRPYLFLFTWDWDTGVSQTVGYCSCLLNVYICHICHILYGIIYYMSLMSYIDLERDVIHLSFKSL